MKRKPTTYDVKTNQHNGGLMCTFKYKGKYYFADLCKLRHPAFNWCGIECMIFYADKNGNVADWIDIYARHVDTLSREVLIGCIEEFKKELDDAKKNKIKSTVLKAVQFLKNLFTRKK